MPPCSRRCLPTVKQAVHRLLAMVLASALAMLSGPSVAGEPDIGIDRMHHRIWTIKDGAPQDVWAIAQTSDGWMWFGGPNGLYRFDGVKFERTDTEPPESERSRAVSALLADESGGLVVGYRNGGVAILRNGQATRYHEADGFDNATVFDLTIDFDHALWVATRSGLHRFDGHAWESWGSQRGAPDGAATALLTDLDGRVWVSTGSSTAILERGTSSFKAMPAVHDVVQFLQSPDGRSWYATGDQLHLCPVQPAIAGSAHLPPRPASMTTLFDQGGTLWTLGDFDVMRFSAKSVHDRLSLLMPKGGAPAGSSHVFSSSNKTMLEDRNGTIWITSLSGDIHQFRPVPLSSIQAGTSKNLTGGLFAAADGAVWLTVQSNYEAPIVGDGLWRLDGRPRRYQPEDFPSATTIVSSPDGALHVTAGGWLWTSIEGRFQRDIPLPRNDGVHPAFATAADPVDGTLWASFLGVGLFKRVGDGWQRNGGLAALPQTGATSLAFDDRHTLWIGYANGFVRSLDMSDGKMTVQALASHVGAARVVTTGRNVIVAGDRGLSILEGGALRPLLPSEPGSFDGLTGLLETADGDVWVNGMKGLVRIRAADLRSPTDSPNHRTVTVRVYDGSDGYPGNGSSGTPFGNTLAQAADGQIWFVGTDVPGKLDLTALRSSPTIAPLLLTSVSTAATSYPASSPVRLPSGTRDFQVDYTALNYIHPDRERFRYRLVGLNDTWSEAGTRRQAFFTNLGPGHYRFEVQSRNETNDWSATPIALDIDIPTTFIQSPTFMALCVALSAIALWCLVQWRVRHATNEAKRLERDRMKERMGERARIAREIHDTLLQNTQAVAMMLEAAASMVRRGQPVAELLDRAAMSTGAAVVEARKRVYELRREDDVPIDLVGELRGIGERLAAEAGAAAFSLVGALPTLDASAAHEVLSIGREALLNAYRHAHASNIAVRLEQVDGELVVRIDDDGIGIDPDARLRGAIQGHWGLPGMSERARRLGGRLTVAAVHPSGTRVELRFNLERLGVG